AREDVVGDHAKPVEVAHRLAERVHQRRLSGAHRPADTNPEGCLSHITACPRYHEDHEKHERHEEEIGFLFVIFASLCFPSYVVPLCLCASVPLCLCASVFLCFLCVLCAFTI